MRLLSLLAFLIPLVGFAANGEPIFPAQGQFHYSGEFRVHLQRRIEIVYGFTSEGQARLIELKGKGYTCNLANRDTYLCSAFEAIAPKPPEELARRVADQLTGTVVEFGPIRGPATFLRKGPAATEWTMPQAVEFNGKHYDSFRFFFASTANVQKLILGDEVAEDGFLINDQGAISYVMNIPIKESNTVSHRYFGEANLTR